MSGMVVQHDCSMPVRALAGNLRFSGAYSVDALGSATHEAHERSGRCVGLIFGVIGVVSS